MTSGWRALLLCLGCSIPVAALAQAGPAADAGAEPTAPEQTAPAQAAPVEQPAPDAAPPEEAPAEAADDAAAPAGAPEAPVAPAATPAPTTPPPTSNAAGSSPVPATTAVAPAVPAAPAVAPAVVPAASANATAPAAPDRSEAKPAPAAQPKDGEAQDEALEEEESRANLATRGVLGASSSGGRLLYRLSLPWDHSVTWPTFFKGSQPTYDPTYAWNFTPNIVWFASTTTWVTASQGISVELTDSDSTTEPQQILLSDFVVGFNHQFENVQVADGHMAIWSVGGNARFPVSKAAQASTRIIGVDANTALAWVFTDVLNSLIVQASTRFLVNASQKEVAIFPDARYPCTPANQAPDVACYTGFNANSVWAWSLGLGSQLIALPNLFITGGVTFTTRRIYGFEDVPLNIDTGVADVPFRGETQFANYSASLGVTYLPASMVSLNLTFSDIFSQRGPRGNLRGPFDAQDLYLDFVVSVFLDGTEPEPDSREDS